VMRQSLRRFGAPVGAFTFRFTAQPSPIGILMPT
jgi:hypothetical protein